MWNEQLRREFEECVEPLLNDPNVQKMSELPQHAPGVSCLDHSIFVAYISFVVCRWLGLDSDAAARAGILHDFYLCDWRKAQVNPFRRLVIHPKMALENAARFGLSPLEEDIILKHMWPVTLRNMPKHRESIVVNLVDKLCAGAEMLHIYHLARVGHRISCPAWQPTVAVELS